MLSTAWFLVPTPKEGTHYTVLQRLGYMFGTAYDCVTRTIVFLRKELPISQTL